MGVMPLWIGFIGYSGRHGAGSVGPGTALQHE